MHSSPYHLALILSESNLLFFYSLFIISLTSRQLFLDYTAETYSKFIQGEDAYEDEDDAFFTTLSKHYISTSLAQLFVLMLNGVLWWKIMFILRKPFVLAHLFLITKFQYVFMFSMKN